MISTVYVGVWFCALLGYDVGYKSLFLLRPHKLFSLLSPLGFVWCKTDAEAKTVEFADEWPARFG